MIIDAAAPYDPWLSRINLAFQSDLGAKHLINQAKQGPVRTETGGYELLHGV